MAKGFFGRDPELRHFPDGTAVVNFSIADTQKWKDKQTGEPREKTEWFNFVATGRRAEVIAEHFRKGSEILIVDSAATTRMYEKDGVKHYPVEYRVNQFEFCGKKSDSGGQRLQQQAQHHQGNDQMPPQQDFNDDVAF